MPPEHRGRRFAQVGEEAQIRQSHRIELVVSDPSQVLSLRDWLRGQPGVTVATRPGVPGSGELGVLEVVTVVASSSGLVAAIRTLPDFIRARRAGVRIEATIRGHRVTLEATNVDDVMPIVEKMLDE
jgi:Effector Associated Constant Component 1